MPFEEHSDHAGLHISLCTKKTENPTTQQNHKPCVKKLCWDNTKRDAFRADVAEIVNVINDLTSRLEESKDVSHITAIVNSFVNELHKKRHPILKKKSLCK